MRSETELRRRLRELTAARKLAIKQLRRPIVDKADVRRIVQDIELLQETLRWCLGFEPRKARVYFLINPALREDGTINHKAVKVGATRKIPASEYYA